MQRRCECYLGQTDPTLDDSAMHFGIVQNQRTERDIHGLIGTEGFGKVGTWKPEEGMAINERDLFGKMIVLKCRMPLWSFVRFSVTGRQAA